LKKSRAGLHAAVTLARSGTASTVVVPDDETRADLLAYAKGVYADFDDLPLKVQSMSELVSGRVTYVDSLPS
jgi:hypothetical protein